MPIKQAGKLAMIDSNGSSGSPSEVGLCLQKVTLIMQVFTGLSNFMQMCKIYARLHPLQKISILPCRIAGKAV